MSAGSSKELSRKLGARGWLGMALPKAYGGGERSVVERFVVVEELLRRGAPLESHWTADRQSGPVINRFGSEELKRRFLPAISRGELTFSIGMSEPDAGSDLASVACRATKVDGGYELSGTKIWTSNAHFADYAIVLCRTSDAEDRHAGLSQLIVDLHSPGVTVNPIPFLDGTEDFNEVVFDGVFVPEDLLLGGEGQGWAQNTSELSFERAGPERWISPYLVVEHFVREYGDDLGVDAVRFLGDSVARWWGDPSGVAHRRAHDRRREAAVGRVRARQRPRHAVRARGDGAHPDPGRRRAVARVVVDVPAPARAGGARRAVVDRARRHQRDPPRRDREGAAMTVDPLLLETAERAFADTCTHEAIQAAERDGWAPTIWDTAAGIGLPWIGVPDAAGGAGGTVADGVAVLGVAGRHAAPIPLAETGLLAGWLLAAAWAAGRARGPPRWCPDGAEDDLRFDGGRRPGHCAPGGVGSCRRADRRAGRRQGRVDRAGPRAHRARREPRG